MVVRRRVVVSGRVQGVWFRDSCAREASSLRLGGSVRNLPDGRVEAVFEGETESVDRMVAWCHHGPSRAVVTGVEVVSETPKGEVSFRPY
jgi:acylphosphatase